MKKNIIQFYLGDSPAEIDLSHDATLISGTVLAYLRGELGEKSVREGCGEGDCGACSVVIAEPAEGGFYYYAVNSCLLNITFLHGRWLIHTRHLADKDGQLHPIQQKLLDKNAVQCGFCTSGMMASLLAMYKNEVKPERDVVLKYMSGNLCRCTGYQSIYEACSEVCDGQPDKFTQMEYRVRTYLSGVEQTEFLIDSSQLYYYRPIKLQDALSVLSERPHITISSGYTDIGVKQYKTGEKEKKVLDIRGLGELDVIEIRKNSVYVGANYSVEKLRTAVRDIFPEFYEYTSRFSSKQIRNIASLVGNLVSASPIGDMIPILMAYRAKIHIAHKDYRREVELEQFIVDYKKTVLVEGEMVIGVEIPYLGTGEKIWCHKISKRKEVDISTLNLSIRYSVGDDKCISTLAMYFGGMAATVKRVPSIEKVLIGGVLNTDLVNEAVSKVNQEFTPLSDARSTAEGRIVLAENLIKLWASTII